MWLTVDYITIYNHVIVIYRFGQKGYLEVDHEVVEKTSPGNLKQLHVQSPIYIGKKSHIYI